MTLDPRDGIAIFTDGSAWTGDKSGGWAWVALDAEGSIESDSGATWDATNNRMEMTAAIRGLTYVANNYGKVDVLVYTDSLIMVKSNQDHTWGRKANKDLWSEMDNAVAKLGYVEWEHIYGHTGIFYNELVDQLAGSARKALTEGVKDDS